MLEIRAKYFDELSTQELHDLLQLRSAVFVVEQDCVYQDIDGKDMKALHILGYKNDKLVAYTRAFKPGDYFSEAAIGRVVVLKSERAFNLGYDIMRATTEAIQEMYNTDSIKLSAQTYLTHFYENLGFEKQGAEYLEDGIPHIEMIRN